MPREARPLVAARLVAGLVACVVTVSASGCGSTGAQLGGTDEDAGAPGDALADDGGAAPDLAWRSQCPAPADVGPADVPSGFLAAVKVTLDHPTDGDTASFWFPKTAWFGGGRHTVRYLYVNTEESYGDETTAFGTASKETMGEWLRAATEIVVALKQDGANPRPDLDPYDRWLGLVFIDGRLVQTRLVREGLSGYYTQYGCAWSPVHESLLHAEAEANAARRGIWAPGHPKDYRAVFDDWIGRSTCRPHPFKAPYCR